MADDVLNALDATQEEVNSEPTTSSAYINRAEMLFDEIVDAIAYLTSAYLHIKNNKITALSRIENGIAGLTVLIKNRKTWIL